MTTQQFQREVARATGESLATVRSHGFSVLKVDIPRSEVADCLCLTCPGCGNDLVLCSNGDALPDWAECEPCDIACPYEDDEVFLPDEEFACS